MSIELKSVSYTYASNTPYSAQALKDINLKIDEGEFVGIIGKTGCGKSTLIHIMDGLLVPTQGTVLYNHNDIHAKRYDRSVLRRDIGVVFQFPEYQLFETTVERDVAFALKHSGLSFGEVQQRVKESLSAVGFEYDLVKDKSPLGFSGGEKRRIAIAGVLASRPKFLILDEPVAGLDPLGRETFLKLLDKLNKNGTAIIMISHNTDALAEHASRIVLMENTRIVRDDKAELVLSDYSQLIKSGVNAGQVVSISKMLCDRGINIPQNTIKYNQMIDEICKIYGRNDL